MNLVSKTKKFSSTTMVLMHRTVTDSFCLQLSKHYLKLKHIVAFIILLSLMQFTPASYSHDQALNEEVLDITPREIENTTLIDFKAIYNTFYVFLKWRVENETEDGLFIIKRSSDTKNFKTIKFKQGIGVSISFPLLYCSIDEYPLEGTNYYRLVKTYQDGRYYYSDVVKLVTPQKTRDHYPALEQPSTMNKENDESNTIDLTLINP